VVCNILSTSVVLPWSTWAMIAMFLISIILFFQTSGEGTLIKRGEQTKGLINKGLTQLETRI